MKLANLGHAQSKETRMKIGVGVRMGWQKRRKKQMVQETCYFEWQNLIAEASRRGFVGEEELHWDSYKIISEKLELEWQESVEQRKKMARPKGSKRAPKSPEQRRKIAEAIAAKWADPEYRERVCSGLSKYHGIPVGVGRKPRRKPSGGTQYTKRDPVQRKTSNVNNFSGSDPTSPIQHLRSRRSKTPLYKDPLACSKLEMIKNIRAKRAATETKKTEAIERARLLIAEAEKAAKALEVAAMKSPVARASLLETKKLIAEAIRSIESIDTRHIMSNESDKHPSSLAPTELVSGVEKETDRSSGGFNEPELKGVNGTKILASSKDEDLNFANFTIRDIVNGEKELLPTVATGYGLASFHLGSVMEQSSLPQQLGHSMPNGNPKPEENGSNVQHVKEKTPLNSITTTKKWVRGRLVEVVEGS